MDTLGVDGFPTAKLYHLIGKAAAKWLEVMDDYSKEKIFPTSWKEVIMDVQTGKRWSITDLSIVLRCYTRS